MRRRYSPEALAQKLGLPVWVTVTGVQWNDSEGTVEVVTDEQPAKREGIRTMAVL